MKKFSFVFLYFLQFVKLQGRKREFENIDIIDVNADDQLTNRNEWLMKSVTEEVTYRPKKKHGLPTQQQKRKHQITYLAFQVCYFSFTFNKFYVKKKNDNNLVGDCCRVELLDCMFFP